MILQIANKFTAAGNHKYFETDSTNYGQSYLKSFFVWNPAYFFIPDKKLLFLMLYIYITISVTYNM